MKTKICKNPLLEPSWGLLGPSWTLLGASWALPWKPPLLKLGTAGHQNVKVLWHIFASFWLSWDAFWSHFGCLGTLLGLILGLSGRPGAAFWPKLAQDSEKITIF